MEFGIECQPIRKLSSSFTISASHFTEPTFPGSVASQCERLSSSSVTCFKCDINRGRFSNCLQKSKTSCRGRSTINAVLILIFKGLVPFFPQLVYKGQFPVRPRYTK